MCVMFDICVPCLRSVECQPCCFVPTETTERKWRQQSRRWPPCSASRKRRRKWPTLLTSMRKSKTALLLVIVLCLHVLVCWLYTMICFFVCCFSVYYYFLCSIIGVGGCSVCAIVLWKVLCRTQPCFTEFTQSCSSLLYCFVLFMAYNWKVGSVKNPELSKIPSFQPGLGQNITSHALLACRNSSCFNFCLCHCAVEGNLPDSALFYGVQSVLFFIIILLCFVHGLQLKSLFC